MLQLSQGAEFIGSLFFALAALLKFGAKPGFATFAGAWFALTNI